MVFITNSFFCNKNISFFAFFFSRVWVFIAARKIRQAPKKKKAYPDFMVMALLEAEYERLTLKTERGTSLPVWGSFLGFPSKNITYPTYISEFSSVE